jgi:hypothetical protein
MKALVKPRNILSEVVADRREWSWLLRANQGEKPA